MINTKNLFILILCCQLSLLPAFSLKPRSKKFEAKSEKLNRVFADLESETKLSGYFMNSNQRKNCLQLSGEERSKFIERFWETLDPNPITPENEFLLEIIQRVHYAETELRNALSGWKSDQGRIYIKYGAPFEILEGTIENRRGDFSSNYNEYRGHSYQVWKYRMGNDQRETFIFFELYTFGDLRLIYSETDSEVSFANWQKFFGDMNINQIIGGFYE
jgi:GWxTD domain-containing protein